MVDDLHTVNWCIKWANSPEIHHCSVIDGKSVAGHYKGWSDYLEAGAPPYELDLHPINLWSGANLAAILILAYKERGWLKRTLASVQQIESRPHVYVVHRSDEGTGNMSADFNRGMEYIQRQKAHDFKYVWMLTNVTFPPDTFDVLQDSMESNPEHAAVHPAHQSSHVALRSEGPPIDRLRFIEWTAPMVSMKAWESAGALDENMPYWGMDLDWSYRVKSLGFDLIVDRRAQVEHTYLHSVKEKSDVTRAREQRRTDSNAATESYMRSKWGADWIKKLWPGNQHSRRGWIWDNPSATSFVA